MTQLFKNTATSKNISAGKDILLSIEDLSLSYGNIHALKNINLKIFKGEVLFVTGPSGSGKTSLLKVIAGQSSHQKGRVITSEGWRHLFISQVFQDLHIFHEKTCLQNIDIAYDCLVYKNRKDFENDRDELCRYFNITDRLHLKLRDANGGLKQKIAIIRSLLAKPDIFIADEPTSSLDSENARKLFDLLNVYNSKRKMTIIWATHNKELIKKFTGRILHLDRGKLIYSGHACFI